MRKMKVSKSDRTRARNVFEAKGKIVCQQLDAYQVPDEKVEKVIDFAIETIAKNPHMDWIGLCEKRWRNSS
jgi:hypothetical protein